MPSKPGYEALSQAKPSRHPEVARLSAGSGGAPAACRVRAPPAEVTASPPQTGTWRRPGSAQSPSHKARLSPAHRDAEHARGPRLVNLNRSGLLGFGY